MKLHDLEKAVHRAVKEQAGNDEMASLLGVDPDRLAIYTEFTRSHVRTALDAHFGALQRALGEDTFDSLYEDYLVACPPSHWSLNEAGADFPEFLETRLNEGDERLQHGHVCLAELEWALYTVQVDPAELEGPGLNPTLALLQQPLNVVPFLAGHHRDEPIEQVAEEVPGIALAFRRPSSGSSAFYRASDALLFAIKVAHEGISVEEAVTATGQPREVVDAALSYAREIGLIL